MIRFKKDRYNIILCKLNTLVAMTIATKGVNVTTSGLNVTIPYLYHEHL